MNMKERVNGLKRDIPAVFLALKKRETPVLAKICAGATIIYALSPIDLIPDFIPVLGYLDDVIILPVLVALTVKLIPPEIFKQCRLESEGLWRNGNPKKWVYALPIAAIWLLIIFFIIKAVWF
ncbi:MAG: YkvA family protein [Sphaerochaetaceae bacterium]